jgi:very-short-patch-repair endonuclease
VEIDGFKYHGHKYAFRNDRQRDYEMMISGFLVLRLPHDMVMEDTEREIEKIRKLVRFRKMETTGWITKKEDI